MSHTIETTALIGSNPLGFMAALGLLKALNSQHTDTRLRFVMRDDWVAEFSGLPFQHQADLLAWLTEWIKSNEHNQRIDWADDLRVSVSDYRTLLKDAMQTPSPALEVLSTQIADGAVDKSKGLVKPTAFYMVSAQQSFLASLKKVLHDVRKKANARFSEALFGPWAMSAKAHGLGLDPAGERMRALLSRAPSKENAGSVSAATWLAFIAMPIFPAMSNRGRPQTTGFFRDQGLSHFCWPICTDALSLETWTTLLRTQSWTNSSKERLRTGIAEVFQSTRHEFGQGYGVFRPARKVTREFSEQSNET
jgi:hypothetical protein